MYRNSKVIIYFLFLLIGFSMKAQSNYTFDYKFLIKSSLSPINHNSS